MVDGGAVNGLVAKVKELGAGQAVVITRPHAVADTFHTDWANKAQDQLGASGAAPVRRLGIYRGLLSVDKAMSIFGNKHLRQQGHDPPDGRVRPGRRRRHGVEKTDEEWRQELTPEEYRVLRQAGHRASVHRRVLGHPHGRRLPVPRLRGGTVHQQREIRFALRLAVLLGAAGRRNRPLHPRPHPGHGAGRGPLRNLRFPPGPRVRGRGLRHPHGPALLHQLRLPEAGPRRGAAGQRHWNRSA